MKLVCWQNSSRRVDNSDFKRLREGNSVKNQRRKRMYWANTRRTTAIQRIYATMIESKREEEETKFLPQSSSGRWARRRESVASSWGTNQTSPQTDWSVPQTAHTHNKLMIKKKKTSAEPPFDLDLWPWPFAQSLSVVHLFQTSLAGPFVPLQAIPARLLGHFAPSCLHLARFARTRFALTKMFGRKKCISIDSKCSETHRNAKEKIFFFTPLTHDA